MKRYSILGIVVMIFLLLMPVAIADRGVIPVDSSVSVHEPGQKAIVAWNGVEEGLILSTNVSSEAETKAVEMIPLPSEPEKVEEAGFGSFENVQHLITSHGLRLPMNEGKGATYRGTAPEIVLHKEIGPHDITVAKADDKDSLLKWVADFLDNQGVQEKISLGELDPVVEDYLRRDFNYWVVDLIEVEKEKSVHPIYYEFDSDFLYYPLEITRPVGGSGKVSLFLLTEDNISENVFPLERAQYSIPIHISIAPVEFRVTAEDLESINGRIADLFAFENGARLTALSYDGPMTGLDRDLILRDHSESSASSPEVNFEPHIGVELGKSVVILGVLVAVLAGVGGFLGTYFGSRSKKKRRSGI